jgi:hypothetical protein
MSQNHHTSLGQGGAGDLPAWLGGSLLTWVMAAPRRHITLSVAANNAWQAIASIAEGSTHCERADTGNRDWNLSTII